MDKWNIIFYVSVGFLVIAILGLYVAVTITVINGKTGELQDTYAIIKINGEYKEIQVKHYETVRGTAYIITPNNEKYVTSDYTIIQKAGD